MREESSDSEPDAEGEGDAAGGGVFLRVEVEVPVDLRFCFGFVDELEAAAAWLVFPLVEGLAAAVGFEVEGPSPGDPDARGRGGLKGSCRRFWAGWRSTGIINNGVCRNSSVWLYE